MSGGERNRLQLAAILAKPCNLLVLDEPTNDLDLETLELLESILADFDGTLLVVSHDREFLDNVATSLIVFEGGGQAAGEVREVRGGFSEWERTRTARPDQARAAGGSGAAGAGSAKAKAKPQRAAAASAPQTKQRKLTYGEEIELAGLPDRIDGLESRRDALHGELADPELHAKGGDRVRELTSELERVEVDLAEAYARWEGLEA